jgi:hypothetical protein
MATFNIRNQNANNIFNVVGDLHFHAGQSREEFVAELARFRAVLDGAVQAKAIDADAGSKAAGLLAQAEAEAQKPAPDKKTLLERLKRVGETIKSVEETSEAVAKLAGLAGMAYVAAQALFR